MKHQFITGDTKMLLKTWKIAYRLARRRGKKAKERFDKEFYEVLEKHENLHKIKKFNNSTDIVDYLKNKD